MAKKIDLTKYGITGTPEILYNPSYERLFEEEMNPALTGYERGQLTDTGAVNVMTGEYTGRSPKDKFFVMDDTTRDTIWWTSDEYKNDNKPVSEEAWKELKKIATNELSNKKLFVMDTFCGANANTRLKIRFIMEVAWQAHFVKNMFIRPTEEELENYGEPDFVVMNASKAKVTNYKELGLNSETAVVFNLTEKVQVIINTWYGGEMKKGMFSYMNYLLPLKGIASMHCSANTDKGGKNTAIFFGVSGTGKTTLFRMIMGLEQPTSGEFRVGETVKLAYVDQQHASIDPEKTVYETISHNSDIIQLGNRSVNARAYVARFNFTGADQEKKVGVLSGGERNRLHLAMALKEGGNVLLLDEPTNDIDVNTLRALEEGLENFAGCAVVISHDRWFLDRVATHILSFEGDSQVVFFEGGYSEYEEHKRLLGEDTTPKRVKYRKLME